MSALLTSSDEQAAFISGILWEITADQEVARMVGGGGGVLSMGAGGGACMLACLSALMGACFDAPFMFVWCAWGVL